jgi:DNA repair protein RadC
MKYINKIKLTVIREKIKKYDSSLSGKITTSNHAYLYCKHLCKLPQEEMHILYLNSQNEVIGIYQAFKGTQTSCTVNPADIIRPALLCSATKIIIAHNHPSGDCNPSKEDLTITKKIDDACEIIGIKLLDHIVIGDNKFYSIKEKHF